jgi:hypothetical protein
LKRFNSSRKAQQNQLIVKDQTRNYDCKFTDSGYMPLFLLEVAGPGLLSFLVVFWRLCFSLGLKYGRGLAFPVLQQWLVPFFTLE